MEISPNRRKFALLFLVALVIAGAAIVVFWADISMPGTGRSKNVASATKERLSEDDEPSARSPKVDAVIPNRLVAIAKASPINAANVAKFHSGDVVVLDGTQSKSAGSNLALVLTQTGGYDLKLQPAAFAKDRVGIRIVPPGKYKFQLTVSDGAHTSEPSEVELEVVCPEEKINRSK